MGALLLCAGCSYNYSRTVLPGGSPTNRFEEIRRRATQNLEGREVSVSIKVLYAEGEEDLAALALSAIRQPIAFLREETGRAPQASVRFYLYPLDPASEAPFYEVSEQGDFSGVLFFNQGSRTLATRANRDSFYFNFPHELAHMVLRGTGIEERWLEDGLAAYLASEFARSLDPDLPLVRYRWTPPLIALSRVRLTAWTYQDHRQFENALRTDPAYALWLGERITWNYAAAEELLRRWIQAATANGIRQPVSDLLARAAGFGKPIQWHETQILARQQTGKTLDELAAVSDEELHRLRVWAWEQRGAGSLGRRVFALQVLAARQPPVGTSPSGLLSSLEIPTGTSGKEVKEVVTSATEAIAATSDAIVADRAIELIGQAWGESLYSAVAPELWKVLAERDRDLALKNLLKLMGGPGIRLSWSERANRALEELSGKSVGWTIELPPKEREERAAQWAALLSVDAGTN